MVRGAGYAFQTECEGGGGVGSVHRSLCNLALILKLHKEIEKRVKGICTAYPDSIMKMQTFKIVVMKKMQKLYRSNDVSHNKGALGKG